MYVKSRWQSQFDQTVPQGHKHRVTALGKSTDPRRTPQRPAEPLERPLERPLRTPPRGKFPWRASRRVVPLGWWPSRTLDQRKRDDNKNKICVFPGGVGGGAERKIVQNAIFRGKRHDNKILKLLKLKVKFLLSRKFVVMAQAPIRIRNVCSPVWLPETGMGGGGEGHRTLEGGGFAPKVAPDFFLELWSQRAPKSTETQKELKWPKSDSKVTRADRPQSDLKLAQKWLQTHFWVIFESLLSHLGSLPRESLLSHFWVTLILSAFL